MILIMFAVFDSKAKTYLPPFMLKTEAEAQRAFSTAVNNPQHNIGEYPADYTLFSLGTFDDETGQLLTTSKIAIGNGVEYLTHKPQQDLTQKITIPEYDGAN